MRAITDEEIETALRNGAQRVEFVAGEQARLPGGQVTFIGSIVDAVIRITAGLGPRGYGNVLDVATYNNVLAVASRVRGAEGITAARTARCLAHERHLGWCPGCQRASLEPEKRQLEGGSWVLDYLRVNTTQAIRSELASNK